MGGALPAGRRKAFPPVRLKVRYLYHSERSAKRPAYWAAAPLSGRNAAPFGATNQDVDGGPLTALTMIGRDKGEHDNAAKVVASRFRDQS